MQRDYFSEMIGVRMLNVFRRASFVAVALASFVLAPAGVALAADTVTTLAISPAKAVYGQPVTFTATVTQKGGTTPVSGGTVTFKRGGVSLGTTGVVDGKATLVVPAPSIGAASATAAFGGSGDDKASTSKAASLLIGYAKTTTALSVDFAEWHTGNGNWARAKVTALAPSKAVPRGSVQFKLGTKVLGTVPLETNGTAQLKFDVAKPGDYKIVATYRPTTKLGFQASTSKTLTVRGSYAISGEVVIDTGAISAFALSKINNYQILVYAKTTADGKATDVRFCASDGLTDIVPSACQLAVQVPTADFTGLVVAPMSLVGATAASNYVILAATIKQPGSVRRSIWLGNWDLAKRSVTTTTLSDANLDYDAPALTTIFPTGYAVLTYATRAGTGASKVFAQTFGFNNVKSQITAAGAPIEVVSSTTPILETSVAAGYAKATLGYSVGWIADGRAFISRYKTDGTPLGAAKAITPNKSVISQLDLEGLTLPMGVVATWTDLSVKAGKADYDVRMRRYDVAGNGLAVTGAATDPKGAQIQSYNEWFNDAGGWGTAWTAPDANGTGVFAKVFDKNGKALSPEFPLNTSTKGFQVTPKLSSPILRKEFLAVWLSLTGNGSESQLIARRFKP